MIYWLFGLFVLLFYGIDVVMDKGLRLLDGCLWNNCCFLEMFVIFFCNKIVILIGYELFIFFM